MGLLHSVIAGGGGSEEEETQHTIKMDKNAQGSSSSTSLPKGEEEAAEAAR